MKDITHSERVQVEKLDAKAIEKISNDITRMLTEAAGKEPNVSGKFHLKVGHINAGFSRSGHFKIVIGGGGGDDDETEDQGG